MSTPSKASDILSGAEVSSTPIFDTAKLMKQYKMKASYLATINKKTPTTEFNPEQVITTTSKRFHEVTLS